MSPTIKAAPIPRGRESDESVAYRAISPPAVISLFLGVASALALVHPGLWIVPAIAAATAVWALWTLAARKTEFIGRKAAILGLGLAIIFAGWAPARLISRQMRLYSEARSWSEEWLQLIHEGRLYEAYELHLPVAERQPGSVSLADLYGDLSVPAAGPRKDIGQRMPGMPGGPGGPGLPGGPDGDPLRKPPQVAIREFYDLPGLKTLLLASKADGISFQGLEAVQSEPDKSTDNIILQYEARVESNGKSVSRPLRITFTRTLVAKLRKAQWLVESVAEPAPSP